MKKQTKAFMPSWVGWLLIPVLVLIWGLITYQTFGTPGDGREIGLVEWTVITLVLLIVGIAVLLMASGKLPAYIIKTNDD